MNTNACYLAEQSSVAEVLLKTKQKQTSENCSTHSASSQSESPCVRDSTCVFLPFPPRRIFFGLLPWLLKLPWLWMQRGRWNAATGRTGSKTIFSTVTSPGRKSTKVSLVGTPSTKTLSPTLRWAAGTSATAKKIYLEASTQWFE